MKEVLTHEVDIQLCKLLSDNNFLNHFHWCLRDLIIDYFRVNAVREEWFLYLIDDSQKFVVFLQSVQIPDIVNIQYKKFRSIHLLDLVKVVDMRRLNKGVQRLFASHATDKPTSSEWWPILAVSMPSIIEFMEETEIYFSAFYEPCKYEI